MSRVSHVRENRLFAFLTSPPSLPPTQVYYKEAVAAFIVFDVTRKNTFDAVDLWKSDVDQKVFLPDEKPVPVILLANKVIKKLSPPISPPPFSLLSPPCYQTLHLSSPHTRHLPSPHHHSPPLSSNSPFSLLSDSLSSPLPSLSSLSPLHTFFIIAFS